MGLTHIKDGRNYWTVVVKNKAYQFDPSNDRYDSLVELVKQGDEEGFVNLLDTGTVIRNWAEGAFKVEDGRLMYDNEEVDQVIAERILEMIEQEFDYKPMLRFVENLYSNPSMRAVKELYRFLEHKHMPITPDGCFLAYKGVSIHNGDAITDKMGRVVNDGDFIDKHSRKDYRNNVGDVNTMLRNKVDDNCEVGCSQGLHVGSLNYATDYAGSTPMVICKVNPADVVSVPTDCEFQKVRTAKYEVVGIYDKPFDKAVEAMYNDDDDDDDISDEYETDEYETDEYWDDKYHF